MIDDENIGISLMAKNFIIIKCYYHELTEALHLLNHVKLAKLGCQILSVVHFTLYSIWKKNYEE